MTPWLKMSEPTWQNVTYDKVDYQAISYYAAPKEKKKLNSMDRIQAYEQELLAYGTDALRQVEGLRIVGTAPRKASILSFVMDNIHPHDLGTIVDREGVAIRTGQHCAQPVMDRLGIPATARASLAMYNTRQEIDALVAALHKARKVLA